MIAVALAITQLVILAGCASGGSSTTTSTHTSTPAAERDPLYSLTLMRQGSILLQQGRLQDALERFHEADRERPGNATVHNMIGLCHLQMEQLDQALASFDRALTLIPSFTDARNNRGAAYLALGQYHLAEVDFAAVLADTTYPHRWQAYYNVGMAQLQQGELGAAEDNLRRAATAPAPVFAAYLRLAELALQRERLDSALDLLEEARLKFPERMGAALELGRLLIEAGRCTDARPHLEEVIDSRPGSDMAEEAKVLLGGC
jgi:type IV pilus assembly protein PilF